MTIISKHQQLVSMMLHCMIVKPPIGGQYTDGQDRLLWKDKTCPARTYLIMSWKALLLL